MNKEENWPDISISCWGSEDSKTLINVHSDGICLYMKNITSLVPKYERISFSLLFFLQSKTINILTNLPKAGICISLVYSIVSSLCEDKCLYLKHQSYRCFHWYLKGYTGSILMYSTCRSKSATKSTIYLKIMRHSLLVGYFSTFILKIFFITR